MTNEQYNGWSNYETWCVNLWLTNNKLLYDDIVFKAEGFYLESPFDNSDPITELQKWLKEYVDGNNPLADNASMFTDLLQSALDNVNYREIAKHFIEQAKESLETQY